MVGMTQARFTGIVSNYQRFSVPVSYFGGPPDTLAIIISSSNMDPPQFPGSNITIDSISFIGAAQPFPNGSFENWSEVQTEEPDYWTTLNSIGVPSGPYSATLSSDFVDGNFSISIESVYTPWNDIMGFVTNGNFGANGPYGGMAVSANPQKCYRLL